MTTQSEALAAIPAKHAQPAPEAIAYLPKGGVNLAYMGHAEVTLALLEIDPLWTWEPLHIVDGVPVIIKEQNRFAMWAKLTVHGKTIIGVGTCETRKGDPEKELIGDFLRNAAMRFGIGTKLWSKATDADPAGRDDVTSRPPRQTAARTPETAAAPNAPKAKPDEPGTITETQMKRIQATFTDMGMERPERIAFTVKAIGHDIDSTSKLSKSEAGQVIDAQTEWRREQAKAAA